MKWSVYNQSLVRRGGEIILGFDVIDNWDIELKEMNKDKIGDEPFHYPNTFLLFGFMLKYAIISHLDKPRVLHKAMYMPMPMENFHQYSITLQ